jgi:hypothetical protein
MSAINRFAAEIVGGVYLLFAIMLVAGGAITIIDGITADRIIPLQIFAGMFCVVMLPGLICGPIALLIDIRNGIREIANRE